jgi:SulP family sulfate permease
MPAEPFPFRRLLVPLSSSGSAPESYLGKIRQADPSIEIKYAQVVPEGSHPKPLSVNGIPADCILPVRGDVLDELLALAAEMKPDLLMLDENFTRDSHRSLARRLAMKAPCSVWMLPASSPQAISKILVPVDFSDCSADALRTAAAIAASQGLNEITVVHVYFDDAVVSYEEHAAVMLEEQETRFAHFLSRLKLGDVEVKTIWKENPNIGETIARTAQEEQCDLIVMGTRGRSQSAAILLGSETEQALMDSTIPTLAVKHFGPHLGILQALLDRRFHRQHEAHFG